jgi:acyl dehydratase
MTPRIMQVGDRLPPLELAPLTRATLALYAGGSGDHIPLHIDSDFARAAGYPDAFMHGMLGAAYVCRMLTAWRPQDALLGFDVRFTAITYPGEALTATGLVEAIEVDGEPGTARVAVTLCNAAGEIKLTGAALVRVDG